MRIEMADAELMVWIDQDLCTGDGICSEIAPDVFQERNDGVWVVKEIASHWGADLVFDGEQAPDGSRGVARVPSEVLGEVVEAAEECPGECIMIEPFDQTIFDKRA
jgi:ferredoxin